jgi:hypothetical protein
VTFKDLLKIAMLGLRAYRGDPEAALELAKKAKDTAEHAAERVRAHREGSPKA